MYFKSSNLSITEITSCVLTHSLLNLFISPLTMDLLVAIYKQTQLYYLTFVDSLQSSFTSIAMNQVLFCPCYLPLVPLSLFQVELTFVFKSHHYRPVPRRSACTHDQRFVTCLCVYIYCILCHVLYHQFIYIVCHYINHCIFKKLKYVKR